MAKYEMNTKIGTTAWIMGMVGLFVSVWVIAKGWEAGSK